MGAVPKSPGLTADCARRVIEARFAICSRPILTPCLSQTETLPTTRSAFAMPDGARGFGSTRRMSCTTDWGWSYPRRGIAEATTGTAAATESMAATTARSPVRRRRTLLVRRSLRSSRRPRVTFPNAKPWNRPARPFPLAMRSLSSRPRSRCRQTPAGCAGTSRSSTTSTKRPSRSASTSSRILAYGMPKAWRTSCDGRRPTTAGERRFEAILDATGDSSVAHKRTADLRRRVLAEHPIHGSRPGRDE